MHSRAITELGRQLEEGLYRRKQGACCGVVKHNMTRHNVGWRSVETEEGDQLVTDDNMTRQNAGWRSEDTEERDQLVMDDNMIMQAGCWMEVCTYSRRRPAGVAVKGDSRTKQNVRWRPVETDTFDQLVTDDNRTWQNVGWRSVETEVGGACWCAVKDDWASWKGVCRKGRGDPSVISLDCPAKGRQAIHLV